MDSQGPDRQVSGPRQRVIKLSWLWQYEDGLSNRGDASDQLLHTAAGAPAEITTPLPSSQPESQDVTPTRDSVIVFLDQGPAGTVAERASVILERAGIPGRPGLIYDQLNGFVLPATDDQARRLRSVDGVSSVERDAEIFLEPPIEDDLPRSSSQPPSAETQALVSYGNGRAASGEVLPWGVQAVWQGQDVSRRGNFASDSYAFVIDSGVLATTGDLNLASNSSWHRSWVPGETPFTDGSGHGTHVAGTIAALANGVGVVGVAPGAQVVSLKVFNSSGTGGSYSSIIEAINHAVSVINTNGLDKSKVVINMSLGGGYSSSLDTALRNAANQGIRIVVAAGNSGADADSFSPASAGDHPNIFTVSAVDSQYRMPSWSNWDRIASTDSVDDVDFAAPGVSVLSYYRNGQLAYLSGTSMAAPHVAGLLLAGSLQAGDAVVPYYAGTSDPFAVAVTNSAPVPNPTYSIAAPASVNEGDTLTFTIDTSGVAVGTSLAWEITGPAITTQDFVDLAALSGTVSVGTSGQASFSVNLSNDALTEGVESLVLNLFSDPSASNLVASRSLSIQDTSTGLPNEPPPSDADQVLWGSTANDLIVGGSGNDRLSGVLATGTSAAAMGFGQIDRLTGLAGRDVFVLGDSRGVFYDDRNSRTLGESDYALISDFRAGEDVVQLRSGSYLFTVSSGALSLYWDRNNNGALNTTGRNRDELIAVMEGVSSLAPAHIAWA